MDEYKSTRIFFMYFIDVIQEYAVIKYGCSFLCSIYCKQFGNE